MTLPKEDIISIITPCFNEGEIITSFLDDLVLKITPLPFQFNIVVIDDCSYDDTVSLLKQYHIKAPNVNF